MGVLLISLIGCGAVPHHGGGRWKYKRHNVTCLFETPYFCTPAKFLTCLCFGGRVNRWLHVMRSEPRVWLQYQQRHDDAAQHQSARINDVPDLHIFTLRVQMLTGFIHWRFTNARWTAYECVRVTLLLHCNAALWFTFIQPTPFFLGPKISVVVTGVRLLGMFSQSLLWIWAVVCLQYNIYSRVLYLYRSVCATNFIAYCVKQVASLPRSWSFVLLSNDWAVLIKIP